MPRGNINYIPAQNASQSNLRVRWDETIADRRLPGIRAGVTVFDFREVGAVSGVAVGGYCF